MTIVLASFNANGLKNITKFEKLMMLCKADIICLQETHWDEKTERQMGKIWHGQFFSSHGTNRVRGVSILINKKNCDINATWVNGDEEGRWVKIKFTVENRTYELLNIHAPNVQNERADFFREMQHFGFSSDVIMGDFHANVYVRK